MKLLLLKTTSSVLKPPYLPFSHGKKKTKIKFFKICCYHKLKLIALHLSTCLSYCPSMYLIISLSMIFQARRSNRFRNRGRVKLNNYRVFQNKQISFGLFFSLQ